MSVMIISFRNDWLKRFFVKAAHTKSIPADVKSRLFRKIPMIDDTVTDQDLRVPPSDHIEKRQGAREGFCPIRINRQWRLICQ